MTAATGRHTRVCARSGCGSPLGPRQQRYCSHACLYQALRRLPPVIVPSPLLALVDIHPPWMRRAACAGAVRYVWYSVDNHTEAPQYTALRERTARRICHDCPVRTDCLQHALTTRERWGIWGGLDPTERAALTRRA